MKKNIITKEFIEQLSYPDFVGLINQWNVLPGAYDTLNRWIKYSNINTNSKLLQVACTTGFQLREISLLTNCSGLGFDLSEYAIKSAKFNKENYTPNLDIDYVVADGYKFSSKKKYSHIIFGAGLGFFPDPQKMLDRALFFLKDEGYLLVSPFYVTKKPPIELIEKFKKIFGITPTLKGYKEIMQMYRNFEILYENKKNIIEETEEEIDFYVKCTVDRAVRDLEINDKAIYQVIFNRLKEVKDMSNQLRKYQEYTVLVLRYRKNVYPNRFVELF